MWSKTLKYSKHKCQEESYGVWVEKLPRLVQLLKQGLTTKEAAEELKVSTSTAHAYKQRAKERGLL